MDRKYNLRLDLQFRCNNSPIKFDEFDKNTSDFFIRITKGNKLIDISKAIVTLAVIKPDKTADAQFVEIRDNNVYCDLKSSMKDIPGKYEAIASIVMNNETVITDTITYEVAENKILKQLNTEVVSEEKFTILTDMINRLSVIENSEEARKLAELSREEAEKQREIAKQQLIDQVNKLIADTNSKVDDNLLENSNKVAKLISDTTTIIDDYKLSKDEAIQQDLQLYKQETTENINTYKSDKNIEIDNYKSTKDTEINKSLSDYKTNTTADIETYKNNKNAEINQYKTEKDLEIDTYVANKNKELDRYVADKNNDIDNYKNSKDTLINDKLREVDTAEQSRVEAEQQRVTDHTERETFLNSFESQLGQIVTKNVEQDDRLDKIEYTNKRQDVLINGLFNENADGRLSITGEGNSVKLEGSKDGVIEVKRVVGNTLVNLCDSTLFRWIQYGAGTVEGDYIKIDSIEGGVIGANAIVSLLPKFTKSTTTYTLIFKEVPKDNCKVLIRDSTNGVNLTGTVVLKNNAVAFTTKEKPTNDIYIYYSELAIGEKAKYTNDNFILLEGDYTNKPIPQEYFEGMKSTFEDKLVTQEMVNSGLEKAENLRKYKANVKVVGKNLFDGNIVRGFYNYVGNYEPVSWNEYFRCNEYIKIKKDTNYIFRFKYNNISKTTVYMFFYDSNFNIISHASSNGVITSPNNACYCRVGAIVGSNFDLKLVTEIQLEEGTEATPYEPYKEFNQSLYLDEPLYKGNELCVHDGRLGYWKNMEKVVLDSSDSIRIDTITENECTFSSTNPVKFGSLHCSTGKGNLITNSHYSAITINNTSIWYRVEKSFASTVEEFKAKLPISIIGSLAEPVFVPILENTPQWILDSFNECTVQFETNVPILSSSFTYTGNVPSVVAMNRNLTNVNNEQLIQNEIDNTTMLAVADVYEMLMPVATMSLNTREGGNKMVELYVVLILRGLKTIEQVPSAIRPQVEEMLKQVQ